MIQRTISCSTRHDTSPHAMHACQTHDSRSSKQKKTGRRVAYHIPRPPRRARHLQVEFASLSSTNAPSVPSLFPQSIPTLHRRHPGSERRHSRRRWRRARCPGDECARVPGRERCAVRPRGRRGARWRRGPNARAAREGMRPGRVNGSAAVGVGTEADADGREA